MAPHLATAAWGYATAAGLAIAALGGPLLGAACDHLSRRKPALLALVVAGAASTAAIAAVPTTQWPWMIGLFTSAFVCFASANVLYDSFLPAVAPPGDADEVSARGFAYGYAGGGLLLALNLAWILWPRAFGLEDAGSAVRLSLVSVGVWWVAFSLPLFLRVPEPAAAPGAAGSWGALPGGVLRRILHTVSEARARPDLFRFLLAYWLYSDGIGTIIKMATVYGSEVGIGRRDLLGALLMVQILAAPASLAYAALGRRVGTRAAVIGGLVAYAGVAVLGYFMSRPEHFWAIAALVALLQGGTQALSRSIFARLVPRGREAELFGFYSVSEKFAGVMGPLIFAAVAQALGSSRLASLSLIPMFLGGAWLLRGVRVPPRTHPLADAGR